MHWAPAFDRAGQLNGWRVLITTRGACLVYDIVAYNSRLEVLDHGCRNWGRAVEAVIAAESDVDLVVVGRAYNYSRSIRSYSRSLGDQLGERLDEMLD